MYVQLLSVQKNVGGGGRGGQGGGRVLPSNG